MKNVNEIDIETQMTKSLKGTSVRENIQNRNIINALGKKQQSQEDSSCSKTELSNYFYNDK